MAPCLILFKFCTVLVLILLRWAPELFFSLIDFARKRGIVMSFAGPAIKLNIDIPGTLFSVFRIIKHFRLINMVAQVFVVKRLDNRGRFSFTMTSQATHWRDAIVK